MSQRLVKLQRHRLSTLHHPLRIAPFSTGATNPTTITVGQCPIPKARTVARFSTYRHQQQQEQQQQQEGLRPKVSPKSQSPTSNKQTTGETRQSAIGARKPSSSESKSGSADGNGNPTFPPINIDELGASRAVKIVVYTAIGVIATVETYAWCVWGWSKIRPSSPLAATDTDTAAVAAPTSVPVSEPVPMKDGE